VILGGGVAVCLCLLLSAHRAALMRRCLLVRLFQVRRFQDGRFQRSPGNNSHVARSSEHALQQYRNPREEQEMFARVAT